MAQTTPVINSTPKTNTPEAEKPKLIPVAKRLNHVKKTHPPYLATKVHNTSTQQQGETEFYTIWHTLDQIGGALSAMIGHAEKEAPKMLIDEVEPAVRDDLYKNNISALNTQVRDTRLDLQYRAQKIEDQLIRFSEELCKFSLLIYDRKVAQKAYGAKMKTFAKILEHKTKLIDAQTELRKALLEAKNEGTKRKLPKITADDLDQSSDFSVTSKHGRYDEEEDGEWKPTSDDESSEDEEPDEEDKAFVDDRSEGDLEQEAELERAKRLEDNIKRMQEKADQIRKNALSRASPPEKREENDALSRASPPEKREENAEEWENDEPEGEQENPKTPEMDEDEDTRMEDTTTV